jgi:hypothetical protein
MKSHDPFRALWRDQPTKEIPEMTVDVVRERSGRLARKVATRKWGETIAGALSMLLLAALGVRVTGAPLLQLTCVLLVLGEGIVVAGMWRRSAPGSAPVGATTGEFLGYYRGELAKERDRFKTMARWYLAPVAPGIFLLPIAICAALGGPTLVAGAITTLSTALTYAVIVAVYRYSARKIGREIEALAGGE